jgi:hypothetical protein
MPTITTNGQRLARIRRLLAKLQNEEDPEIRNDLEVQLLDLAASHWRDPWLGDIDTIKVMVRR